MSDTPGRSGKGVGTRADVAPCLQAQTTVEVATDDRDEANAVLSGYQSCSAPTSHATASEAALLDEILVDVTPILLGDGDGNLITADSSGQLPWAKHILERLSVLAYESLEAWYRYFDTDAQHFFVLMQSLPR